MAKWLQLTILIIPRKFLYTCATLHASCREDIMVLLKFLKEKFLLTLLSSSTSLTVPLLPRFVSLAHKEQGCDHSDHASTCLHAKLIVGMMSSNLLPNLILTNHEGRPCRQIELPSIWRAIQCIADYRIAWILLCNVLKHCAVCCVIIVDSLSNTDTFTNRMTWGRMPDWWSSTPWSTKYATYPTNGYLACLGACTSKCSDYKKNGTYYI